MGDWPPTLLIYDIRGMRPILSIAQHEEGGDGVLLYPRGIGIYSIRLSDSDVKS